MKTKFIDFFTANYGMNSIIIGVILLLLLITLRIIFLKRIPQDKVEAQQKAEFRDKYIILRDKYEVRVWKSLVEKSEIIVLGVHGLQGQKDDFKLLANYCKQQKWSLITFDRRGAGKNQSEWKFKSFNTDVNDVKDVIAAIKTKYPNQKIIVFGEAIGAAIASYACKNNNDVDGLITSNLITKNNLYPISLGFYLRFIIGFIFTSHIKLPIYIEAKEISSSNAYITNMNQRYSLKQVWSLKYLLQLKKINKNSPKIIRNLAQPTLILQSADDVFSDFHQLKVLTKKWKDHQTYHFAFSGKHALINEPEMKEIFAQVITPWVNTNTQDSERT